MGAEPSEIKNWFGSEAFFFDIIFAGQQLSRTCKSVIRLSFLAGRGDPAGNGLYLQGPSHLGLPFQTAPTPMYAKKFFL